ncbi:MAG TPA: outer membrane beta-barrel protein [Bryobacteraceae bacterium]|jgi:opacity protein-like surface antigen|nr:outer membrane beta-barrel protein [Bryobacteraceae bacterium]
MRRVVLFLMGCMPVLAQPFSAGIKAGIPLTDFLDATNNGLFQYSAPTQRYIIGGVAELRLPAGFGVEFDALYRHLEYSGSGGLVTFSTVSASGSNWEFPLLLKYRFHVPVARPYVDAGVAWDTITGLKETINEVGLAPVSSSASELQKNTTMGFVVGAGVDIHAIFLHISPEIRYTRWGSAQINATLDTIGLLHSNLNQGEFLVGFTF